MLWMALLMAGCLLSLPAKAKCTSVNTAFKSGEELSYKLFFNWKFIWVTVGTAEMSIKDTDYNGAEAYRCHLITRGNKRADRLFVLRDTLVSVVNKDVVPCYYRKGALEGDRYTVDEAWYSYPEGKCRVRQRYKTHRDEIRENDNTREECVYDMISMMMRARSFDPADYKVGQKIQFPMADGGKIKNETLIYRGKKNFKMEDGSRTKYRCLVFSFVEYKDNKEKEVVTFYITDDKNHLPVRLDLYLRFGSAKAFLTSAKGVRNPQTSIID